MFLSVRSISSPFVAEIGEKVRFEFSDFISAAIPMREASSFRKIISACLRKRSRDFFSLSPPKFFVRVHPIIVFPTTESGNQRCTTFRSPLVELSHFFNPLNMPAQSCKRKVKIWQEQTELAFAADFSLPLNCILAQTAPHMSKELWRAWGGNEKVTACERQWTFFHPRQRPYLLSCAMNFRPCPFSRFLRAEKCKDKHNSRKGEKLRAPENQILYPIVASLKVFLPISQCQKSRLLSRKYDLSLIT